MTLHGLQKSLYSGWEQMQRSTARYFVERGSLNWKERIKFSPPSLGNLKKRRQNDCNSQIGWRIRGERGPLNPLRKAYMDSQRMKQQAQGLHGSMPGPLCMYYSYWRSIFMELLSTSGSLTLACSMGSFLPVVLPQTTSIQKLLLHLVLFRHVCLLFVGSLFFPHEGRRGRN